MSKLAFVTGAAGFLGRHVARNLVADGWRVAGLGHSCWREGEWQSFGLSCWHTSTVTLDSLRSLLESEGTPQAIFHCAGGSSVTRSVEHPREDFQRTVGSTVEVLEFSRLHASKAKVIYPSSAAVYGATQLLPIPEDAPCAPISPYGLHKRMVEMLCMSYAENWHVPVAVVRFFSLYGVGLCKQLLWDAACKAHAGGFTFFGCGEEQRDWLHVSDAAVLLQLAERHAGVHCPIVNGGSGSGVTVRDLLQHVGTCWTPPVSPCFTGKSRVGDPSHLVADCARSREWGFKPAVNLETGLSAYIQWFMAEHL